MQINGEDFAWLHRNAKRAGFASVNRKKRSGSGSKAAGQPHIHWQPSLLTILVRTDNNRATAADFETHYGRCGFKVIIGNGGQL